MPCGECLQRLPPWDDFLFCGIYEGPLRELVLHAKFSGGLSAQAVLGKLLAARCSEHYSSSALPDFIVPMPLHSSRLRERGYDQCVELARPLAKLLGLPLRYDVLQRVIASPPQSRLSREQRKKLPQPFSTVGDVSGAHILLIDDVCTTGATLSRATEALRSAGARRVDAAVIARTSRHTAPELSENEQHVCKP
jgi:ComF family protein